MVVSLDFLNLPGVRTTNVTETEDRIIVEAETINPDFPRCGMFCDLSLNGNRQHRKLVNDTPHSGKAVMVKLRIRRAKCSVCGKKGIYEVPPHVQPRRQMTKRMFNFIAKQGIIHENTHSGVGRHVHVSEGTARGIVHEYIDARVDLINRETPRVIGIDEKNLMRQLRAVVGNIEARTIVNMLPDREGSLERFLRNLPNQERIDVICIDQFDGYRTMAKKLFPGRAIVTDHFHVVRKANQALDRIRAGVAANLREEDRRAGAHLRMSRKLFWMRRSEAEEDARAMASIRMWGERFPILRKAYDTKEAFFDMYTECHSPAEAERYYRAWRNGLDPDIADHFVNLANIQKRWLPHVFAYFEHPFTTGYVEAVNRTLKAMHSATRGSSFELVRGKLMLAPKLESKSFRDRNPGKFVSSPWPQEPLETFNWGIDLRALEAALTSRTTRYELIDGRYVATSLPHGLATIEVVWEDAA